MSLLSLMPRSSPKMTPFQALKCGPISSRRRPEADIMAQYQQFNFPLGPQSHHMLRLTQRFE
jgi:hypothetical protein